MKFSHMIPYSISFKSCFTQFSVKCNGEIQGCQKASTGCYTTRNNDNEWNTTGKYDDEWYTTRNNDNELHTTGKYDNVTSWVKAYCSNIGKPPP